MPMLLSEYLEASGKTPTAFSTEVRVTHGTVSKWVKGSIMPRPEQLDRIIAATGGTVTADSFYRANAIFRGVSNVVT